MSNSCIQSCLSLPVSPWSYRETLFPIQSLAHVISDSDSLDIIFILASQCSLLRRSSWDLDSIMLGMRCHKQDYSRFAIYTKCCKNQWSVYVSQMSVYYTKISPISWPIDYHFIVNLPNHHTCVLELWRLAIGYWSHRHLKQRCS